MTPESAKEWNFDRILSAQAQITQAQNDMMVTINRGYINAGMKLRMVEYLRNAADDIEKMVSI